MSCPRRALVGQCTRRSDSPCSYARTEWKLEPGRAPQQQAAAAGAEPPGVAEEAVGRYEAWVDDHRRRVGDDARADGDEPEEVAELHVDLRYRVDAAWERSELELAGRSPAVCSEARALRPTTSDRAGRRPRAAEDPRSSPSLDLDVYAIAFDRRRRTHRQGDRDGSLRIPRPHPRERTREEEAHTGDGERRRARGVGGGERDCPEREPAAPSAHEGARVSAIARSTASSPRIPAARASGATMTLCARTALATEWTSSGMT